MRRILVSLALMATAPFAQAETWELFNGSLTINLPDGFAAEYTPLTDEEVERTDLVRLVRTTSPEDVARHLAGVDLPGWQKANLLDDEQGEVIAIFEDFVLDPAAIDGHDGDILKPLIEEASAESWHEALTYVYTSYLGQEGVVTWFDEDAKYGIVVVPEISQVIHVQKVGDRPLIIAGVNKLAAALAYAQIENSEETPDFSLYQMSDVEREFDEACMLDVVRAAYASASWKAAEPAAVN